VAVRNGRVLDVAVGLTTNTALGAANCTRKRENMENANNPASRLHEILSKLVRIPKTNPCAISFAMILAVPPNNALLLFERIARMAALAQRAREQVLASGDPDVDYFLKWLPQVETAFSTLALPGALAGFTDRIDPVTLERIQFCGIMLSRRSREPQLIKEELAHLSQEIEQMIGEVKESQIDEDVRRYMLRHLSLISEALREYDLFGPGRIQDEVDAAVGSICSHQPEAKRAGDKYWDLIVRIGSLVQTAAAGLYIADFLKLIPGH
jgi:hypothetical protein